MLCVVSTSCARPSDEGTASPEPAAASESELDPSVDPNTYVSTSLNETTDEDEEPEAAPVQVGGGQYAVTTPDAAKQIAEDAVADQLDPRKSWSPSPVLPSTWPSKNPTVDVFFYPMAASQASMSEYQLFTPAFRVTVSLVDATTTIKTLSKRRKLGGITVSRPSSLERRELDMAETALIRELIGLEIEAAGRPYWGYLKYIHEHPKFGKDLERRSPKFIGWVRRKHGR